MPRDRIGVVASWIRWVLHVTDTVRVRIESVGDRHPTLYRSGTRDWDTLRWVWGLSPVSSGVTYRQQSGPERLSCSSVPETTINERGAHVGRGPSVTTAGSAVQDGTQSPRQNPVRANPHRETRGNLPASQTDIPSGRKDSASAHDRPAVHSVIATESIANEHTVAIFSVA